ncbi:MAG: hypothetical protein KDB40_23770 [Acidimicrobiales bacterium]|nr:hypothetical protein [Acidimicrobiales bacterium]MCB9392540.1 hypothetical protein [Acidimicrobiaceae bacterium]
MASTDPAPSRDRGVVTPIEMMFVLVFVLVALVFLGFVGRLHAAGVQVTNTSQAAARAASMASDAVEGQRLAEEAIAGSTLVGRCRSVPSPELTWEASPSGTWQGGSVTVTVRCSVPNGELSGVWTPGDRTISASDTQPIDRYQR